MIRSRSAFTLLEVMVALAILVVTLVILVEIQADAARMTLLAQRYVTASGLAQDKLSEVRLRMEQEGFYQDQEIHENGDFSDLGDDATNLEFGHTLDDFHWRYDVIPIDVGMVADVAGMAQEFAGQGGEDGAPPAPTSGGGAAGGGTPNLNDLGISNDQIGDYLAKYIRHVEVEVWWGDDHDAAAERGDNVLITGHVTNPTGVLTQPPEL